MEASHVRQPEASPEKKSSALSRLVAFVEERRRGGMPVEDFEAFEREAHELFMAAERELLGEELARFDVDVPVVVVEGVAYRKTLRCEETYFASAGPVRVERNLYAAGRDEQRQGLCPLEVRAGIVEGRWTPLAARQATWVVAHLTPAEGERLFATLGGMTPSKSSLDRLPKRLSARWEEQREQFEASLRQQTEVPAAAVSMAVSLDGVLAPMKDGQRAEKRARAAAEGKQTKGPAGYREIGCGTVSFFDAGGERLSTLRMARMPESKKASLKAMLASTVAWALSSRPDLRVVKVADAAHDNWTFLVKLPDGEEVVDFFHAAEHLGSALAAAYGDGTVECRARFDKLRLVLRDDPQGVEKVIRSLRHLRDTHKGNKTIARELGFFRNNRRRMPYARLLAANLPIGSGVVEAACKTLVTERMKRSGMRWGPDGGQAVLTFRAAEQSGWFDHAWSLLAATYKREIELPDNVLPFPTGKAVA